ncbi:MAG: roadblock/LC7 domain-containing protein [Promethearchaeota archaeon]|nr:MAG: roadblock/LC7 domain-containing protein [Candidatus Lokiarchaeota archaeon]
MSFNEDERVLKKILKVIINSTAGVKYVILVDDSGITLLSESKFKLDDDAPVKKMGAIGGAVLRGGEEQGHILGYGNIRLQITEYDKGMLFSHKIGKGVICIATERNVNIGFLKAVIKKYVPKLRAVLDRYLTSDQDAIKEELKGLLNSSDIITS